MNLSHLTDKTLLEDVKKLSLQDRKLDIEILYHLAEIDRRKLFSSLKYPSLYEYCIKELKFSEGSTHRRIVAARVLHEIPEVEEKLISGALNLMNVSLAVKFMKENNIRESEQKKKIISQIENLSKKACEQKLFEITGRERPKVTTITIMDETFVVLQTARAMLGGYLSNDELITKIAQDEIQKIQRERYKQTPGRNSPPPVEVNCVISAKTKREKYAESPRCFICGSITNLQFDHREPKALGGSNDPENIRLLCFNCNQRSRIEAGL